MIEMPDDVITGLIAAVVAARADGDGVRLTIAAVRARLLSNKALRRASRRLEDTPAAAPKISRARLPRKRQQEI